MINLAALKKVGFERTGFWTLDNGAPALFDTNKNMLQSLPEVGRSFSKSPAIYLFTIGKIVKYVGKAGKLDLRIDQYRRAFQSNRGKLRVDNGISEVVMLGGTVSVYSLIIPTPRITFREGLPFDYLDGLEQGIIQTLDPKPEWNKERRHSPPA
jgi:hypothetical protein